MRNTPAYAGKTVGPLLHDGPSLETPPLTRGRLTPAAFCRSLPGNTPAYAGKTRPGRTSESRSGKHPRLRGEDSNILYKDQSHNTKYAIINCSQRFPLRLVILT